MSVFGYSISKGKTRFNIHLSSTQINSWTGQLYDANYTIDLRGHLDSSDFQKEYNVNISFESEGNTTDINVGKSYAIHLDIGNNKINSTAYRERATPSFIAFKTIDLGTGSTVFTRFNIKYNDNSPLRIKSLYNLDRIGFNLFDIQGQTTFVSTLDYQLILSFEEV